MIPFAANAAAKIYLHPHLTHGSLSPPESSFKTASRSVQLTAHRRVCYYFKNGSLHFLHHL